MRHTIKKEQLIETLQKLPDGTEVWLKINDRITVPHFNIFNVAQYPEPENLVVYIDSFYSELCEDLEDKDQAHKLYEPLTDPVHDYLFQVCHHGRDMMGWCGACEADGTDTSVEDDEDWDNNEAST